MVITWMHFEDKADGIYWQKRCEVWEMRDIKVMPKFRPEQQKDVLAYVLGILSLRYLLYTKVKMHMLCLQLLFKKYLFIYLFIYLFT